MLQPSALWSFVYRSTVGSFFHPVTAELPRFSRVTSPDPDGVLSMLSVMMQFFSPPKSPAQISKPWLGSTACCRSSAHLFAGSGFYLQSPRNTVGLSQGCHLWADVPNLCCTEHWITGLTPLWRDLHPWQELWPDWQIRSGKQENNHLFSQMHNNLNNSDWISGLLRWRACSHPDPLIRLLTDSTVKK